MPTPLKKTLPSAPLLACALASLLAASLGWAAAVGSAAPVGRPGPEVPPPEAVLGFRPGADGKLADWDRIAEYFGRLAAASDRVRVEEVGRTTEGRAFLVVTISSPANLARLESIRQANLRLADPRGLGDAEAERLLAEGKTIVSLNHGIHSTEVAAPLASAVLAWELATGEEEAVRQILDQTVVLMIPSQNPDGTQKVAEWAREWPAYDSGVLPFLYQKYVGHDDNRDWYMFTQQETRLALDAVYERWRPQIVHDLHQMGRTGARLFAPPYVDPWEPNVDPALRAATNALGTHVAATLTAQGKPGVVVHALYDAWTPARAYPFTHGGVRLLTECASARLANPVRLEPRELAPGIGYDPRRASWNFPDPWPGGAWRLGDIVDYQLAASRAILEHAARQRGFWLRNFLEVNRRACARADPYAFVVPAGQADPLAAWRLLSVLASGGVEVRRAAAPFEAEGRAFAAGASVILMAQPASAFAKQLLERQRYPDLRQYPGGPPQRPYDVTAHTLSLLLGVEVVAARHPFAARLDPPAPPRVSPGRVDASGRFLALGHKNGDLVALGRLLAQGVPVRWALGAFVDGGRAFPPGTLLVPSSARAPLAGLAAELGVSATAVSALPRVPAPLVRRPRVGLYQSWVASMDEGWTRFVFEKEAGVAYRTLHDEEIRRGGLRRSFDAIVLADQTRAQILDGQPADLVPPRFTGGLGTKGARALESFVAGGGTLIALNRATELAIRDLGLPVRDALGAAPAEEFFCPGAILRVEAEPANLLAHGLERESIVWFEDSPAFEAPEAAAAARYGDADPLLSGWLLGGERLRGKAALVAVPLGAGRVVLFGFRPQYRAQSWATYLPLLNAIYSSAFAR